MHKFTGTKVKIVRKDEHIKGMWVHYVVVRPSLHNHMDNKCLNLICLLPHLLNVYPLFICKQNILSPANFILDFIKVLADRFLFCIVYMSSPHTLQFQ